MKTVELLAPARDLEAGMAAIDCGADAVYIGGARFGARRAATNSAEDVARLVEYARPFGVRVYAALNTVVFDDELAAAEATARELIDAGVDALIVQDMAYLRMGLTGVELHASTQMCNTIPEGVRFLEKSGFSRVILERGLTLAEIEAIRRATTVDLECFVHGAICVGFSGHCYLSRSMGPRSGNRGECSQPCRLPYDLVDGRGRVVMSGKHLLSVQDMNLSDRIPQLIDAGIGSFKIEGRLKEISYVKNIVAYYRREIDRALVSRPEVRRSSSGGVTVGFEPDPVRTFSRGGTHWMLDGKRAGVASFDTPKAVGQYVGTVSAVQKDCFEIVGNEAFAPGDGVCFFSNGELLGTQVNRVDGRTIWPNRMEGIVAGGKLYRNYDHRFVTAVANARLRRAIQVKAQFEWTEEQLRLTFVDEDGERAAADLCGPFDLAKNPDKMRDTLRAQVTKCGDTIFEVTEVALPSEGPVPFVPVSVVNDLRRRVAEALYEVRRQRPRHLHIGVEDAAYPYPAKELNGTGNVTNHLAERFYHEHGVERVAEGLDMRSSLVGECVMTSAYCLRRELGECLRGRSTLHGPLFLRRGTMSYRLEFDCDVCRMRLIKEK